MKRTMSLATLLVAIVALAGCCNMCGDKKPKKAHHKKEHHASPVAPKKKSSKSTSEYQKFCTKCDKLLNECRCYL